MTIAALRLRIDAPTGTLEPGRGFYQRDEEALYVQVGEVSPERSCFSYLEADTVRFDLDQQGRLMGIEVAVPRRRWPVDKRLRLPKIAEPADVRWLDFRAKMIDPELVGNKSGDCLLLRFAASESWRWYVLAENVHVQVDPEGRLTALLVTDIVDDYAGRNISRFRKRLGRLYDKAHQAASHPVAN